MPEMGQKDGGDGNHRRKYFDTMDDNEDMNYRRLIFDIKGKLDVLSSRFDIHERNTANAISKLEEKSDEQHENLKTEIKSINDDAKISINKIFEEFKKYVSAERYKPVEMLVYGMSGTVLLAVFAALVALVVNKTGG